MGTFVELLNSIISLFNRREEETNTMRQVTLTRISSDDYWTRGSLTIEGETFTCKTFELPWKNNLPNQSCIPTGKYTCKWLYSPSHQRNVYHVMDVLNRTSVEIHSANIPSQLLGCIALGFVEGELNGQKALLQSKDAIAKFESIMSGQDFELVITN